MQRVSYKLNRAGRPFFVSSFTRIIVGTIVCCVAAMAAIIPSFVMGQTQFRPSNLFRKILRENESRLAKQQSELSPIRSNVGEKAEFQFRLRSESPSSVPSKAPVRNQVVFPPRQTRVSPRSGEFLNPTNSSSGGSNSAAIEPFLTDRGVELGLAQGSENKALYPRFIPAQDEPLFNRPNRQQPDQYESLPPPLIETDDNPLTPEGVEVITQRYSNGEPQIIRHVAQDEEGNYYNHGSWQVRSQSGRVIADGTYVRGLMDGQWRREHTKASSALFSTRPFSLFQEPYLSVAQFKEGQLNGVWTIYDRRRTKIFEITYVNGVRHGNATWFYPNQAKMREATFKQGLIDGEILEYDDADKLVSRQQFVEGRRIVRNTTFYRPSVKKSEDYFLASKLEPEDQDNWWEAKPTPYLARGSEIQNGPSMAWYDNGQPRKRGQFKDGKPIGQFTWWHANGNKQTEGFYIDGKKSRRWTKWYENGFKELEGVFEDNQPVGIWRAWLDNGELRAEKDYQEPVAESRTPPDVAPAATLDNEKISTNGLSVVEPGVEPTTPEPASEQDLSNPTRADSEPSANISDAAASASEQLPPPPSNDVSPSESTKPKLEEVSPNGFREPKFPEESVLGELIPEESVPPESSEPDAEGGQIDMDEADKDKSNDEANEVGSIFRESLGAAKSS